MTAKKLLFIELNEFSMPLMKEAAVTFQLPYVKKLLDLPYQRKTVTKDQYDSGYLEPWVQWVSVHTGTPSDVHKIKHLGDVSFNRLPQIWESLSQRNISSGIWSAMNATRGASPSCRFFLPDPWTFEEKGYPSELNQFLNFPRYMARNYLNLQLIAVLGVFGKFLLFMSRPRAVKALITELPRFCWHVVRYRGANFVTYSLAEYLSVTRFVDYWKKNKPQFSSLFLNLVAHAQHYYWSTIPLAENERLRYVFHYLDKILEIIFEEFEGEVELLFANALTQINTNHESPWILYRQKDHVRLLNRMGIAHARVEACMTHDAHIFFQSESDALRAREILESAHVDNHPFFHVESYPSDPKKLFYMIQFSEEVNLSTHFRWSNGVFHFEEEFQPIVRRTAKHAGTGIALSTANILPELPFPNHQLRDVILNFFGSSEGQQGSAN